jgi:hypothetical protein
MAAGVASGHRMEVDEPALGLGESTTTGGAGDRGALAVTDGDRAQLGIGWLDHRFGLPGCEQDWTVTRQLG